MLRSKIWTFEFSRRCKACWSVWKIFPITLSQTTKTTHFTIPCWISKNYWWINTHWTFNFNNFCCFSSCRWRAIFILIIIDYCSTFLGKQPWSFSDDHKHDWNWWKISRFSVFEFFKAHSFVILDNKSIWPLMHLFFP